MAGSPRHELDESADHRADPAAVADRRADALAGRKARINLFSSILGLGISVVLIVVSAGNWGVPFGIVLVVDHLSALMLARWDRAGASFHALFQIQLMGLYGAFLTADLFNLFVFFEVLLAASYGLMLHGSGRARVSAGLHYISINLLASSLFLIGAARRRGDSGHSPFWPRPECGH